MPNVRGVPPAPVSGSHKSLGQAPVSPELRAAADALAKEWPKDRTFGAGLEAVLARTSRMKDENRLAALNGYAGAFTAGKLGLTPQSEERLGDSLGKRPKVRGTVIELLAEFPSNDGFMKELRKELHQVFPELNGHHTRSSEQEQIGALNGFMNTWALTKDALGEKVYAQYEKLLSEHPHDEDFLRGLRELVRTFPRRRALTGSMPQADQLSALKRYAASYADSAKIKEALVTGGVQRKGPLGSGAPAPDEKPFSNSAREQLAQAFTPEAMAFFDLYGTMQDVARGQPPPHELGQRIDDATAGLNRMVGPKDGKRISADVLNDARLGLTELKAIAGKLGPNAAAENPLLLDQFRSRYQGLTLALARDKGVHLTQIAKEKGTWGDFRLMSERQVVFDDLVRSDPQVASMLQQRKQTYREIDDAIQTKVVADGRLPRTIELMGRLVTVGVNPKDESDQLIYDLDGGLRNFDDFKEHRSRFLDSMKRLAREPDETEVPLSSLRTLSDKEVDRLEGPVERVVLTDDKAKHLALTRDEPVKWTDDGHRVIVDGRFKGIYVDDLVNANGRMIEGSAYRYDERRKSVHGVPVKANPSDREPYATLTQVKERGVLKDKLFLQLPNMQGEWTAVRQAMRRLTQGKGAVPTIQYSEGSRNTSFYFDPKDYAAVRDAVGGLSLSSTALGHLEAYFNELTIGERALTAKNVANFSEKNIPGLKPKVKLLTPQKEAMAWLEANGNAGVIALDTGIGKTLTAIAQMQKLLRDGFDIEAGSNGRFIFVCPKALRGNIVSEIHKFLEPEEAAKLVERLDVLSYDELARANRDGTWQGKPFDSKAYVSAFFDEAQDVNKDTGSLKSRAALGFDNPRKVVMTASPMEQNPMEAYVLDAIAHNINLRDPEQRKQHLTEMKRFKERYCETLGGRIIGVKKDPLVLDELHTWMKQRVFFRNKQDVPEFELPQLRRHSKTLVMSEAQEKLYDAASRGFDAALRGLVSIYRDQGLTADGKINPAAKNKRIRELSSQLSRKMRELRQIATAPATLAPKEVRDELKAAQAALEQAKKAGDRASQVKAEKAIAKCEKILAPFEEMGFPTVDAAKQLFRKKLKSSPQSRAALFADNRDTVTASAITMSNLVPGTLSAACFSEKIVIYKNGSPVKTFVPGEYRKDPSKPPSESNRQYKKNEWQQFVMQEVLLADPQVKSITMQGQVYNQGQNLQALDTVFHLDMVMNGQDMSQREARVWRQGNLHDDVDVYELVPTFGEYESTRAKGELDLSVAQLDQIYVELFQQIFDDSVKASQQAELGKPWFEADHKQASTMKVSTDRLELLLSPWLKRAAAAQAVSAGI